MLSTDAVVHELYASAEVRDAVVARWGPEVAPAGTTDRAAVARRAFATPEDREWLEGMLWPRVGERIGAWREEQAARDPPPRALVVEVPLLFEAGMDAAFDATLAVVAEEADPARARRGEGARVARRAHGAPAHPGGESGPGDVHGRKLRHDRGAGADARRGT